jgi:hypothetical protein
MHLRFVRAPILVKNPSKTGFVLTEPNGDFVEGISDNENNEEVVIISSSNLQQEEEEEEDDKDFTSQGELSNGAEMKKNKLRDQILNLMRATWNKLSKKIHCPDLKLPRNFHLPNATYQQVILSVARFLKDYCLVNTNLNHILGNTKEGERKGDLPTKVILPTVK